jgi:predicted ester cyclase
MSTSCESLTRRWFEEVWNQRRESTIDEMLAPQAALHGIASPDGQTVRGPSGFKVYWRTILNALPDVRITVLDTVTENNKVAVRCLVEGTHHGEGLGVAVTKQKVKFTGIGIAHFQNGQIAEAWNEFDFLGVYQQLGAFRLPAA